MAMVIFILDLGNLFDGKIKDFHRAMLVGELGLSAKRV
jgi:hypothetical protein